MIDFFGNGGRDKERFARHPEIALRVIWWDATLVSKSDPD
jgi:hypothetical protein